MIKFDAWQFPNGESHLPELMGRQKREVDGRLTYQYNKYELAMKHVKRRGLAIDVGSHVGLWAYFMARDFEHVACFEPMPPHIDCWLVNMRERKNAELFMCALGHAEGKVSLETRTPGSSGDTQIIEGDRGTYEIFKLDTFNFKNVDFIKIDCEGYEVKVIEGGYDTIMASKPCIIVEQKGNMVERYGYKPKAALTLLQDMGAKLREEYSGDYVLSWDEE